MVFFTHWAALQTLAKTLGCPGRAQTDFPQETTPCSRPLQTSGPPESPCKDNAKPSAKHSHAPPCAHPPRGGPIPSSRGKQGHTDTRTHTCTELIPSSRGRQGHTDRKGLKSRNGFGWLHLRWGSDRPRDWALGLGAAGGQIGCSSTGHEGWLGPEPE